MVYVASIIAALTLQCCLAQSSAVILKKSVICRAERMDFVGRIVKSTNEITRLCENTFDESKVCKGDSVSDEAKTRL